MTCYYFLVRRFQYCWGEQQVLSWQHQSWAAGTQCCVWSGHSSRVSLRFMKYNLWYNVLTANNTAAYLLCVCVCGGLCWCLCGGGGWVRWPCSYCIGLQILRIEFDSLPDCFVFCSWTRQLNYNNEEPYLPVMDCILIILERVHVAALSWGTGISVLSGTHVPV